MKRQTKILIALFILAFIIRGIFVFATPLKIWDETVYANLGFDLSKNLFDYSVANNGWSDFIPSGGDNFYAWPKMGFRAPLLPYLLSILYLFNLDFLVNFFMVFVGALSVCLVYLLGKTMFNRRVALYSAVLFLVIPLHVIYSAHILTGVLFTFFALLTFFSFWEGYEEGKKKYKVLFGFFLALALLSRYTALWIMPVFLLYFLVRDKSLKFLKDKYLWSSILVFFVTLIPWFIYGFFTYNNILGAFIHGFKSSGYWGGLQSWSHYFSHWGSMFSIIGFVFCFGLIYILCKKDFLKKEIYLLLIWFGFFLGMAIYMPHKEDRFILPIAPVIAILSGYFISKIRKYKKLILAVIILVCAIQLVVHFVYVSNDSYTDSNACFLEANKFLADYEDALVVTDESAVVYYYTRQQTYFYPNPWDFEKLDKTVREYYLDKESFVLFPYSATSENEKLIQIKKDLDENLEKVFACDGESSSSLIYKF
jgi:4-amino-4-deoxy-L-arabinose transferase-like glycosyltransferase